MQGLPGGSDGQVSACSAGDLDSIPGLGRSPGEGNAVFLVGESYGQRSLEGYSPWVTKTQTRLSDYHNTDLMEILKKTVSIPLALNLTGKIKTITNQPVRSENC